MLIVVVLSFFIVLSGYVVTALNSSYSTGSFVQKVYAKQQAYHALVSLVPYILEGLRKDDQSVDTLLDLWALPFEFETSRGKLEITIYDEERFVNPNYIGDKVYREVFERLLKLLEISPGYVDRVLAWIGKGLPNYRSEYPIKHAPMDSPYELKFVGFTPEELYGRTIGDVSYPGLLSLVTTYSSGKININTAPKYILMALDPRIDSSIADRIIEFRSRKPFRRPEDLVLVEGVTFDILHRIRNIIDVKSSHFRVKATVKTGDVETTLELVYDRVRNKILYKRIY